MKYVNINNYKARISYRAHVDSVNSINFIYMSNNFVTASADKTVSLWDMRTNICQQTFYGHNNAVNCAMATPSGDIIASCDADGVVKFWDVRMIREIGSYEEIVDFCLIDDIYIPTLDFGHINAYTLGGLKTKQDFENVFLTLKQYIGDRYKNVHIHFSKIEFGEKGELRHLTFEENAGFGPDFEILAEVLKEMERKCISANAATPQDQEEYNLRYNSYIERYEQLSSRFDELTVLKEEKLAKRRSIERFIATLSKQEDILTEFDNWLWLSTVERVTVNSDGTLVFKFYYGAEIEG